MLCDVAQIQFRKATLQDVAELLQIDKQTREILFGGGK